MTKLFREEFYFEPRVVNLSGEIKWYSETYTDKALVEYLEGTVYIRDNGSEIYVYKLLEADYTEKIVVSTMELICRIKKLSDKFVYGRELK